MNSSSWRHVGALWRFDLRSAMQDARGPTLLLLDNAELVDRLDRLPLAIELVAARLRLESLDRVARSLDGVLDVRSHRRDAPSRQVSLRAAIEGSWGRLSPRAQRGLAALTVFRGSFPIEAAEAVIGEPEAAADADGSTDDGAGEILEALVDRSLVRVVDDGLALYVSIRAFAAERLPPEPAVYRRLAEHLIAWDAREGPETLGQYRDTFAAAFEALVGQPGDGERVALLWLAWHRQGRVATPLEVLRAAAVRLPVPAEPGLAARICLAQMEIETYAGRPREALALGPRAVALAEANGDTGLVGQALNAWAHAAGHTSETTLTGELLDRALALPLPNLVRARALELHAHRAFGTNPDAFRSCMREALDLAAGALPSLERRALHNEGVQLIGDGSNAAAVATFRDVLARCAAAGDVMGKAAGGAVMAQALNGSGEFATARAVAETARAEAAALGALRWEASAGTSLAVAQAALGEAAAAATAAESLALARAAGDDFETLLAWAFQAWTLALLGDAQAADASLVEARTLEAALGITERTHDRRAIEHAALARARLG